MKYICKVDIGIIQTSSVLRKSIKVFFHYFFVFIKYTVGPETDAFGLFSRINRNFLV